MLTESPALSPDPSAAPETEVGESEIKRLIDQARDDSGEARPFMEPKTSTKRKRGRPRKDENDAKWQDGGSGGAAGSTPGGETGHTQAPSPPGIDIAQALRGTFTIASGMLVKATGSDRMALGKDDIEVLSVSWGAVANRYAPAVLASHGEIIIACANTAIIASRLSAVAKELIAERKAAQAAEAAKIVPSEQVAA